MDTRSKILKIAFEAFIENGFEKISLNQIIKQSDLTKGAFYHYFKSKNELLSEVINNYFIHHVKETTESMVIKEGSTRDKLLFIAHAISALPDYEASDHIEHKERKLFDLFISAIKKEESLRNQFATHNEMILEALSVVLAEGIKRGEIKESISIKDCASIINAQAKGTLFTWVLTGEGQLEENLSRNLLAIYDLMKC